MNADTSTRADLLTGLEEEVTVMVHRIRRVVRERAQAVHPELQASSFLLLSWLTRHGPLRGSALAESFYIDKGAISRQVQHLEELGLVDRTPDPDDGRALLVAASATAVERLSRISDERRRLLDQRLDDWSDADLTSLVELLRRYNVALS